MRNGPGTMWPAVPPGVADQIRPLVADLAEQMVTEISAAVTEYARLSDPVYARNLRLGAEAAIAGFADRIARRTPRASGWPTRSTGSGRSRRPRAAAWKCSRLRCGPGRGWSCTG
jgi:hypothetical protein